jgi:hypothetical protein
VRVSDRGCECRRGQHGGREQNGRDFPVHSSFFLWGIGQLRSEPTIMRLLVCCLM